jgi:hypothetical protein
MPHNKADLDFEAEAAGQSGDTQGISDAAEADSERVEELLEEGQPFEAGVVSGVEPHLTRMWRKLRPENSRRTMYLRNISIRSEHSDDAAGDSAARI